eukprot:GFUD01076934.1.p1 GENE.GFUD01076934.1~~GFUD01076934.1.p1  ORF type:complete len:117 (-),score=1.10 GFUD01076934.1:88-438(-)
MNSVLMFAFLCTALHYKCRACSQLKNDEIHNPKKGFIVCVGVLLAVGIIIGFLSLLGVHEAILMIIGVVLGTLGLVAIIFAVVHYCCLGDWKKSSAYSNHYDRNHCTQQRWEPRDY